MAENDRRFYRVGDGPVMDVIREAERGHKAFLETLELLAKEFGGDAWVIGSRWFAGIAFHGHVPAGWRKPKSKEYSVPDKRVKAGRDLDARFRKLPQGVDGRSFSSMLHCAGLGDFMHWGGGFVRWTTFERFGDTTILSVPAQCNVEPPNCTELKMSEYWAIRESAKESV